MTGRSITPDDIDVLATNLNHLRILGLNVRDPQMSHTQRAEVGKLIEQLAESSFAIVFGEPLPALDMSNPNTTDARSSLRANIAAATDAELVASLFAFEAEITPKNPAARNVAFSYTADEIEARYPIIRDAADYWAKQIESHVSYAELVAGLIAELER